MSSNTAGKAPDGIAIIGMAGRFPGAQTLSSLWENLKQGKDCITRFTDEQLAAAEYDFISVKDDPGFVKARGVLDNIDLFDASFFGFTPREAAVLDPQQRLWFECVWEALENASHDPAKFQGLIGVFAGGGYLDTYLLHNLCADRDYIERLVRLRSVNAFLDIISNDKDFLPTRTSYLFNLRGPSVNIQTACSTSLVAVCQACQSLLTYESDLCLAGGVSIQLPQVRGYLAQDGGMDSSDGYCRVFDAKASGTVFGNGIGVVVLRRLADALADGDTVLGVIRGYAVNNDGSGKLSFIAPGIDGQTEVITMALSMADVDPSSLSYIEAHGTATQLGDPIEIAALTRVFRSKTAARQFCGIGSVKSNVGHLDAAAGVAGLIKTLLALRHNQLPPNANFETPNPEIDFENSPFYVVDRLTDWKPGAAPRRAGISSFGVGGTNAHIVIEEPPAPQETTGSRPWQLLTLSAKTTTALEKRRHHLVEALQHNPDCLLADVAFTLRMGRSDMDCRCCLVCRDRDDALRALTAGDGKRLITGKAGTEPASVVFMFPGQGAQHVNMARELYQEEPVFRSHVDSCAELLTRILDVDLRTLLYPPEPSEAVTRQLLQTRITQPALFVIEYALAQLWMSWGIHPAAMIGHSIGDYVAACLAQVFSLEDALAIVAARGRLMQEMPQGGMLAVRLSEQDAVRFTGDTVALAAVNAPSLCVLSGAADAIADLKASLAHRQIEAIDLQTSHAFHSAMMEPALKPFVRELKNISLHAPSLPFISSLTGTWITDREATSPDFWAEQLRRTVRFSAGVRELQKKPGTVLLEVGPGKTLTTLALQHADAPARQSVFSSLPHPKTKTADLQSMLTALGQLWLAGIPVDGAGFYQAERRRRVALPAYPFEKKRYWVDPPATLQGRSPELSYDTPMQGARTIMHAQSPGAASPQARPAAAPAISAALRRDKIMSRVREIMADLSGIDAAELEQEKQFLEMGLDSLFLTQFSTELQKQLRVKIRFRQLLEEFTTLKELTDYLDAQLPPDQFAEPAAPVAGRPAYQPAAAVAAQVPGAFDRSIPEDAGFVERVIQQQLDLMAQQMEILRGVSTAEPGGAFSMPPAAPGPAQPRAVSAAEGPEEKKKPFGAQARIDISRRDELTPEQQKNLDELIRQYTARTRESKKFTQTHRACLADPRAVSGFIPAIKELVYPIVVERSSGSKVWDIDGNQYVDMTNGFGANIFGHLPPFITEALEAQLHLSIEVGPQHPLVGETAQLMCEMTGLDRVAFCNTGSEAVMGATRIARTVTGRDMIAIFTDSYHGIHDEVIVRGTKKLKSIPAAPGIPAAKVANVLVLDYGAEESLRILRERSGELAAIMVEPVQSRNLSLQPKEFIHELRRISRQSGAAFIMDEVITGFRVHPGGAQAYFGVRADIATYGKIIGGGMPIGAIAGIPKFMDALDGGFWQYGDASFPAVGVTYFAGTFVRHPLALAAARATLLQLKKSGPGLQERLNANMAAAVAQLRDYFTQINAPIVIKHFSSSFQVSFSRDLPYGSLLFYWLRLKGLHIFEGRTWFITTAHTEDDIAFFITAFKESVREMQQAGFMPEASFAGGPEGTRAAEVSAAAGRPAPAVTAAAALPAGAFPLTEAQLEIWFASQMGPVATCSYNEGFTLDLRGPLHMDALRTAVQEVYARHEAHHLRFSKDGDYQQVSADTAITIELHDFSMLDAAGQKEKMAAAVKNDATTPFDLMRGPLLWVKILKLSDEHHVFLSTAHHIIFDGWSAGVFLDEISIVYNALCRGTPYRLPEAPRFSDYAAEEARQQSTAEGIDALQYWKSMFSDPPPFLDLPTDRPRPPVKSYRGASTHYEFDPAVYAAIKNVAAQQRTTLYALLLAAYNALLFRLSGQDDIVAGIPTAGQSTTDKHSLIGHCVNILPLRSRMKADMPFKEFLAATKTLLLDAQDHQQCTFGSILRTISLERNPARSPLVEVIFNLNRKLPGEGFHNLASSIHEVPKRAINWDMFLNMSETDTGLITDCDYNTDLFDEATIRRWLGHFETLLAAVAANPEQPLATIPVLSAADRTRLLTEWNATAADYPAAACIHTLIEAQARTTPDRVAVSCQGTTVTYRELDRRANQLARSLQQLGVGAQVPVGIFLERSCDMLIGLYAILKAGGAYVPLDPEYPQERLAYMISDAAIPVLVSQRSLEREIPPCAARVIYLDADPDIARQPATDLPAGAHNPEQAAYIIYTSGSTGKPKGVQVPHRAVVNFLTSMRREPGFSDNDVLLAVTTLSFDIAVLELFLPLIAGGTTVILPRDAAADGTRLQAALAESKATVMQATPGTWRLLLETGWKGSDRLKVLCGGEAFPRDLAAALHACCPNVWNMYGPTETTVWSTCYYLKHADGPVPIGRPINNTQVYILDDSRQPVPIGVPGELYIGGAGVALGYFNRPDLTAEKFVPSPFSTDPDDLLYRTGDLVKYHPDGAMEYLGRRDTQVKVRGFRIELGEIETVLCAHDAVAQAAVIVRQEGPGDTRLAAYVVASPGRTIDLSGLRAFLRSRLPEYMLPQHIVALDALPLTPNNKIDRQALAQQQHDTAAAAQSFVAPATATEQALAALWQHVLNADRVGLHDNFFDLGGHSLLATRVVSRVRDIFNIELPLRTLFETPTVHLVAQHIDALRESSQQAQPARQGAADREVVEF